MKRRGRYRPTVEDTVEISGIETLHPGGHELTRRTAEVAGLRPGLRVLDVSSGRGTQAVWYAARFGVEVVGVDIAEDMVATASARARLQGVESRVRFERGDSQALPFEDASFDVVINECAVGIPDDSQRVLDEMLRVVRPGGRVVIHESTWTQPLEADEKDEIAERFGTTPLEDHEWIAMLRRAGAADVDSEIEPWSSPERFWKIRQDRDVRGPEDILTTGEWLRTAWRVFRAWGLGGVVRALVNERRFWSAVRSRRLGYGLYWGVRPLS